MQKILELKNEDWSKGISAQGNIPIGGLFQRLDGVDPFYNQGMAVPSLTPDEITTSVSPKFFTSYNSGGVDYVYWAGGRTTKQILKDSPYTQVDRSSEIVTIYSDFCGAIVWRGKYIYSTPGNGAHSNSIPLANANDTILINSWQYAIDCTPMTIGADGNLYCGDGDRVHQLTNESGTSGNSNYLQIDTGFTVRDMINNGRYLVVLADNNVRLTADRRVGNYRCRVYFWDMIKTTSDIIYDLDDSYLSAGEQLDGNIYFFGYNGLYVCNEATSPKMVRPFVSYNGLSRAKPLTPYQLVKSKGSIYWIDGSNNTLYNGYVYAYGNPTNGLTKIFYKPHINSNGGQTNAEYVLQVIGDQFWVGTAQPRIWVQNIGSTRGVATVTSLDKIFPQPYRYELTKVVLSQPLSSGQSVTCEVTGAGGSKTISAQETKSYSASNPRQVLIFKTSPTSLTENRFEDMRVTITSTGATIQRVTVYGTPLDDISEII